MSSIHVWKTDMYDKKLGFVSEFGKDLVGLLNPARGESIFDLGCGTGDLAYEISKAGAIVTGMDVSSEMIEKARAKYPDMTFIHGNAEDYQTDSLFDAVFSNAALHWVKNAEQAVRCIWNSLHAGGRFVAEFGGHGNVETIVRATSEVLYEMYGVDAAELNPWYFPSIGEYCTLLEQQGFHVTYAIHYDRPTQMEDGEEGLVHWLTGFSDDFFKNIAAEEKPEVMVRIAAKARKELFHNGSWFIDYKRIRIRAIKP